MQKLCGRWGLGCLECREQGGIRWKTQSEAEGPCWGQIMFDCGESILRILAF